MKKMFRTVLAISIVAALSLIALRIQLRQIEISNVEPIVLEDIFSIIDSKDSRYLHTE